MIALLGHIGAFLLTLGLMIIFVGAIMVTGSAALNIYIYGDFALRLFAGGLTAMLLSLPFLLVAGVLSEEDETEEPT